MVIKYSDEINLWNKVLKAEHFWEKEWKELKDIMFSVNRKLECRKLRVSDSSIFDEL